MAKMFDELLVKGDVTILGTLRTYGLLGNVYYVDSGHADTNDNNDGKNPKRPMATIDAAYNRTTANNNDFVLVAPRHAENIAAATGINMDKAGVTILGLKNGNLMPTVSFTAAAGSITIGAANNTLKDIKLVANFATGVTVGITIAADGDGCTLDGIVMRDNAANKEFLKHIQVATTVTDLLIKRCSLVGLIAETMSNSIHFDGTSIDCVIEDTYIFVDSSDDVIDHLTAAGVNLTVRRCVIINQDTTTALYCLRAHTNTTGVAHDNRFAYNKVDAEVSLGAAMWWFDNKASNTIAESGLLDPATTHAIP